MAKILIDTGMIDKDLLLKIVREQPDLINNNFRFGIDINGQNPISNIKEEDQILENFLFELNHSYYSKEQIFLLKFTEDGYEAYKIGDYRDSDSTLLLTDITNQVTDCDDKKLLMDKYIPFNDNRIISSAHMVRIIGEVTNYENLYLCKSVYQNQQDICELNVKVFIKYLDKNDEEMINRFISKNIIYTLLNSRISNSDKLRSIKALEGVKIPKDLIVDLRYFASNIKPDDDAESIANIIMATDKLIGKRLSLNTIDIIYKLGRLDILELILPELEYQVFSKSSSMKDFLNDIYKNMSSTRMNITKIRDVNLMLLSNYIDILKEEVNKDPRYISIIENILMDSLYSNYGFKNYDKIRIMFMKEPFNISMDELMIKSIDSNISKNRLTFKYNYDKFNSVVKPFIDIDKSIKLKKAIMSLSM